MRHATPSPQPPGIAAWLVSLFGFSQQAESILGDLAEEFSDIASKSGVASARRWYWRQSLKAVAYLTGSSFRTAPWSLAGVVLLGLLLQQFSFTLPERMTMAILRAQRPYSNLHYRFYVWLINYGTLIACVVTSLLIGCVVAVLAKGKEVVAAFTLIVVRSVPFVWLLVFVYEHNADHEPSVAAVFHFVGFRWVLDIIGILVASVLVRKVRSVSRRPLAIT